MAAVAMFHSALGVRPGLIEGAEMLRSHGHAVHVVDQYDGKDFDDYEPAGATVEAFDYSGSGHLFADPSKAGEYQPAEAELMWSRVLDFLQRAG